MREFATRPSLSILRICFSERDIGYPRSRGLSCLNLDRLRIATLRADQVVPPGDIASIERPTDSVVVPFDDAWGIRWRNWDVPASSR